MKVVVGILLFALSMMRGKSACANSYLEMITTAPENHEPETVKTEEEKPSVPLDWWYDSRIVTSSPVVVSSYPKYYAWAHSKAYENVSDDTHEHIQNLIYAVETGLLGWGIYEIYKY